MAMVWSQPITWKTTWLTISGTDGFTLPGMIDEPGCTAGNAISESPARGPMLSRRKSLAILPTSIARRSVPTKLLAERHRHGVLQMGATGLERVAKLPRLSCEAGGEFACGADEAIASGEQRETRRRRKDVVRRLRHVDVVVRVNAPVGAAGFAEHFTGAVREHLVRVHVV